MAPPDRLKRRVLREAVRENVDTIHGLPPAAAPRRPPGSGAAAIQAALLVALPMLGLFAYNPLSGSAPDRAAGWRRRPPSADLLGRRRRSAP